MIAAVAFRNFKALRQARLTLETFNLLIGPNGSGKTSVIQALLRLGLLAKLPLRPLADSSAIPDGPEITFEFAAPHDDLEVLMSCVSDLQCDLLQVLPAGKAETLHWSELVEQLTSMRGFALDHRAMAEPSAAASGLESNGGNVAGVLAMLRAEHPAIATRIAEEFVRIHPEFEGLEVRPAPDGRCTLSFKLTGVPETVPTEDLSQGCLYMLGMLTLAFHPSPPALVCIEEIDRGIHPRLLREVRDTLYRLSYPDAFGEKRKPVQVVATTHSPYMLDLFSHHPEEVVISAREGVASRFSRLSERKDLADLLEEGTLGDIWYAGVLGGVPPQE